MLLLKTTFEDYLQIGIFKTSLQYNYLQIKRESWVWKICGCQEKLQTKGALMGNVTCYHF